MSDGKNITLTDPSDKVTDTSSILSVICHLVSFLIANVVKTEQEWMEWGKPFLKLVFTSQFALLGDQLFGEFESQFFPLVGHGMALWIDDTIAAIHNHSQPLASTNRDGLEDYVLITSFEDKLSKILAEYLLFSPSEIEDTLLLFFTQFYQYLGKIEHYYDSRERSIARKVCQVLNFSAHQFSDVEKEILLNPSSLAEDSKELSTSSNAMNYPDREANNLFLTLFQHHSKNISRESLVVSYRMWRVAFIAAGGGAMVGIAGFIAAPSIVSTVMPVLCNVVTFIQLSATFDTFLSYVGIITYPLIPSIFTTYGASVAGSVMMKRTAALKEFELLPLHIHSEKVTNHPNLYDAKDKTGIPIFILVNGHVEKNIDARVMWGANGTDIVINEHTISSTVTITNDSEASNNNILVEKNYDDHPEVGIVFETLKELQEDLLAESKLIAESIVQSIETVSLHPNHQTSMITVEKDVNITAPSENTDITTDIVTEESIDESKEIHEWEQLEYSYSQGWWKEILPYGEEYILSWENDLLSHLTESFLSMIKHKISSKIMGHLKEFFYQQITPLHAIQKSIGLPNLALAKIRQLDDIWVIAMDRAMQGGKLLAKILLKQFQSHLSSPETSTKNKKKSTLRPITLVGYGMGARLIYHCLEALLEEGKTQYGSEEAVKGIIENVVLIGTPVKIDLPKFQSFRTIISGRFINCYSRYDWILALLYRSKSYELLIAGLYPIYLPHQSPIPTRIANQKEQLFIQKFEANEQTGTIDIGLDTAQNTAALLEEKAKLLKERLRTVQEESIGIENYDITDLVYLQTDYPKVLPSIMKLIELQSPSKK